MSAQTLDDLIENFSLFDDWEERYRYLIDLGRALPPLDDAAKIPENKVEGCVSQVWMIAEMEGGRFVFTADSDAAIVRGLIAVLQLAYNGKSPEEIHKLDIEETFRHLGLESHLSPNRRNGFFAMVGRIHTLSGTAAATPV